LDQSATALKKQFRFYILLALLLPTGVVITNDITRGGISNTCDGRIFSWLESEDKRILRITMRYKKTNAKLSIYSAPLLRTREDG
jgi:hypothetical protein